MSPQIVMSDWILRCGRGSFLHIILVADDNDVDRLVYSSDMFIV